MQDVDANLIRRFASSGDAEAYAAIVNRHAGLVFSACHRVLRDRARAEEASQETFLHLLRRPESVSGSVTSWLHTTATWKAIDMVRHDSARRHRETEYQPNVSLETSRWEEISPCVDQVLSEMSEQEREILIEHFLKGKPQSEIARERKMSQPTVSRRIDAALEQLRSGLRKKGVLVGIGILGSLLARNAAEAAPTTLMTELGKMSALAGAKALGVTTSVGGTGGILAAVTTVVVAAKGKLIAAGIAVTVTAGGVATYQHWTKPDTPPRLPFRQGSLMSRTMPSTGTSLGTSPTKSPQAKDDIRGRPMGMLYTQPPNIPLRAIEEVNDGWQTSGPAIVGQIRVPAGRRLRLDINRAGARHLEALDAFRPDDLQMLMMCGTQPDDRGMSYVGRLTALQVLHIHGSGITDEGIRHLRNLKHLRHLDLSNTQITDRALAYLSELRSLEFLSLAGTRITSEGVLCLTGMTKLKRLNMSMTQVGDEGLSYIKSLPNLRDLVLKGTPITDAGLTHVGEMPQLEQLFISGTAISDSGMDVLSRLPSLKVLGLIGTNVGDKGLMKVHGLKRLEMLQLSDRVTDQGLAAITEIASLRALVIPPGPVTDRGLQTVSTASSLQSLICSSKKCTDAGMEFVAKLQNLERLTIGGPITDAGLARVCSLKRLKCLEIESPRITEAGLANLSQLDALTDLCLVNVQRVRDGFSILGRLKRLERLRLFQGDFRDDQTEFLSHMTSLKSILLEGGQIGDSTLSHLASLTSLESLELPTSRISDAGLKHLARLTRISSLTLGGTMTDGGLASLHGLASLKALRIAGPALTPGGMAPFETLPMLQTLQFPGSKPAGDGGKFPSAPIFETNTLDGKRLKLEDFSGRIILLHFWNAEEPEPDSSRLQAVGKLRAEFGQDQRLALISLSLDDDVRRLQQIVQDLQPSWPQVYLGPYSEVAANYVIERPIFVVVSPDQKIVGRYAEVGDARAAIVKLLEGTDHREHDMH